VPLCPRLLCSRGRARLTAVLAVKLVIVATPVAAPLEEKSAPAGKGQDTGEVGNPGGARRNTHLTWAGNTSPTMSQEMGPKDTW
jgi:hypothetical protein